MILVDCCFDLNLDSMIFFSLKIKFFWKLFSQNFTVNHTRFFYGQGPLLNSPYRNILEAGAMINNFDIAETFFVTYFFTVLTTDKAIIGDVTIPQCSLYVLIPNNKEPTFLQSQTYINWLII